MTPRISLLHATYGRPSKAAWTAGLWYVQASWKHKIEYVLATNSDDPTAGDAATMVDCAFAKHLLDVVHVRGDFHGSAPAWDAAAKASTGQILVQVSDDVEPPPFWDQKIVDALAGPTAQDFPLFLAVSDGFRKDRLCTTAIMNRARYEQCGEFLHAGYRSVFSDDEVTCRAYADQAKGKCLVVEARQLVFKHRHHYHDKTVPMDSTYERGNSAEAYRVGHELFSKRNADILKFRTW